MATRPLHIVTSGEAEMGPDVCFEAREDAERYLAALEENTGSETQPGEPPGRWYLYEGVFWERGSGPTVTRLWRGSAFSGEPEMEISYEAISDTTGFSAEPRIWDAPGERAGEGLDRDRLLAELLRRPLPPACPPGLSTADTHRWLFEFYACVDQDTGRYDESRAGRDRPA